MKETNIKSVCLYIVFFIVWIASVTECWGRFYGATFTLLGTVCLLILTYKWIAPEKNAMKAVLLFGFCFGFISLVIIEKDKEFIEHMLTTNFLSFKVNLTSFFSQSANIQRVYIIFNFLNGILSSLLFFCCYIFLDKTRPYIEKLNGK